jgi:hypothetical protein
MKRNNIVLVIVLIVGAILAFWGLWPRSGSIGSAPEAQKDSLLRGETVFWPEQQAYFRIRNGQWEKSPNLFNSPFTPVATEEASEMLTNHFKTGNTQNSIVGPEVNESHNSNYNDLINEADSLLYSGKQKFDSKNYVLSKFEFEKALIKAKAANEIAITELTKAKIDTIDKWIAKCEAASQNPKQDSDKVTSGSTNAKPKNQTTSGNHDASGGQAGGKKTTPVSEVKTETKTATKENAADTYWANYKNKIKSDGTFKGTKEEAKRLIEGAPTVMKYGKTVLLRPLNGKNARTLDQIYIPVY